MRWSTSTPSTPMPRDLLRRARGVPLRLASKSLRVRALQERALAAGFVGTLCFTLPEALWLASNGWDDLVVAYPTVDRGALRELAHTVRARTDHGDGRLPRAPGRDRGRGRRPREGLHRRRRRLAARSYGDRREALAAARRRPCDKSCKRDRRAARARARRADGLRGADRRRRRRARRASRCCGSRCRSCRRCPRASSRAGARRSSTRCARSRRCASSTAAGPGSIERTAAEPAVTEVAAGSGLYGPTLFDTYRAFKPRPAALFALPVVRKPSSKLATALGGGYPASGAAGRDRLPRPFLPAGLKLDAARGRGRGPDAARGQGRGRAAGRRPRVVPPRQGGRAVRALRRRAPDPRRASSSTPCPTYRGEGKTFL